MTESLNVLQWNPCVMDIGTSKPVLLIEVSFVEGSVNIIRYQNRTRKVSLVVRCPLFKGILYKGFLEIVISGKFSHNKVNIIL